MPYDLTPSFASYLFALSHAAHNRMRMLVWQMRGQGQGRGRRRTRLMLLGVLLVFGVAVVGYGMVSMWIASPNWAAASASAPAPVASPSPVSLPTFDGTEKYLEVRFADGPGNLRSLNLADWTALLKPANCRPIEGMQGKGGWDAFVLAESSLLVSDRSVVLTTCGRTTPLAFVSALVRAQGGRVIERVVYRHKAFALPAEQPAQHRSVETEREALREVERLAVEAGADAGAGGGAIADVHVLSVGDSGNDHMVVWQVGGSGSSNSDSDSFIELVMSDVSNDVMGSFKWDEDRVSPDPVMSKVDVLLRRWLPAPAAFQRHKFHPEGFSVNGVSLSRGRSGGDGYVSLHVTPGEPTFVSVALRFKAPLQDGECKALVDACTDLFKPLKAILSVKNQEACGNLSGWISRDAPKAVDVLDNVFFMKN